MRCANKSKSDNPPGEQAHQVGPSRDHVFILCCPCSCCCAVVAAVGADGHCLSLWDLCVYAKQKHLFVAPFLSVPGCSSEKGLSLMTIGTLVCLLPLFLSSLSVCRILVCRRLENPNPSANEGKVRRNGSSYCHWFGCFAQRIPRRKKLLLRTIRLMTRGVTR